MLAILASVLPLLRPVPAVAQLLKMEGPKGELVPGIGWAKGLRWGMDPARNLDSNVEPGALLLSMPSTPGDGVLLNGICDGVCLELLDAKVGMPRSPLPTPPGENLDGRVPARARRVWGRLSGGGSCTKSGKPSVGDSGMFSRRGVEFPLVGGPPQGFMGRPETPSWA